MGFKLRLALLVGRAVFPHSVRRASTVWAQSVPSARSNRDLLAPACLPACCKKIVLWKSLRKYRERRRSKPRARGNRGHPLAGAGLRAGAKQKGQPVGCPISNHPYDIGELPYAFFSSAGFSAGGAACCGGGVVVCDAPDIPSLKLRMPSPSPRASSGILRPPNKRRTIARTLT